jgi:hypothetical protein
MASRPRAGLKRSAYANQPAGVDAWLGDPQISGVSDVSDVSDVEGMQGLPSGRKKPRTAGPKWDPDTLQQLRDAVLFLRQQAGRPTMTLTDALDESAGRWLEDMRQEHNGGEAFPTTGRLR